MAALEGAGATVHYVGMRRFPGHPVNAAAVVTLRRLVSALSPVVVHGHSAVGGALGRLGAAGTGAPVLYTPNGLPPGRASLAVERALARWTDRLIAVSDSEGRQALELGLVPEDRLVVVPNGIDLAPSDGAEVSLRDVAGVPAGVPLVGTVARLVPQKAPELFVAACAEVARHHPDTHYVLIGMGPGQAAVDGAVRRAGIHERWHQVPHLAEAAAVLGQLDVFVLASAFEGGPYTPLEAMRAGTPVVLTDVVGNRDAVEPGVSGFLAPFGDATGLAGHVLALLGDPELRLRTVEAARRRLTERFDARVMGSALDSVYREVADVPRSPVPA